MSQHSAASEPSSTQVGGGSAASANPETSDDAGAKTIAKAVFDGSFKTIERYVDILTGRGVEWGLIGPREPARIWGRHILNCASLSGLLPHGSTVMDIGSGAGLPGIPLAVLRPDLEMVLVESLQRRATFLDLAVDELGLADRVTVVRGRAEDQSMAVDVVTCRAVAPLEKLLKWTANHFLPDGALVALKGASANDDLAAAGRELARRRLTGTVVTVRADQRAEPTQAIVVRKI
ncbi:16S rRNA (guanine(527)-N(7))-methyltransferase RsmG [Tessaracoccus sp. SD287]|nr:16S rRNA (guanine(527)-N(7))-methyltransferase RsmG [Tessaracoccus sp. SD287]